MKVMNLVKLSLIGGLMMVFLSIDSEPVNASAQSTASQTGLTQQDKPLRKHRHIRRKHRRHRRWKRHHHRFGNTNDDRKVPPMKNDK